jgi:mannosyltransferase OCH1-like enzyme
MQSFQDIIYNNLASKNINIIKNIDKSPFPMKNIQEYNLVVPANIFQTWHSKNLPPLMFETVKTIKRLNPRFKHYLFDDNDCREFIKNHFSQEILEAYDSLIPGAYKADLWRYCILYKYGGIYLDIKYIPVNGFKFINLLESEHWPLDINKSDIYNALLVCKPGNEILLNAINKIVEHVKTKYYGHGFLSPTGPALLGALISSEEKNLSKIQHITYGDNDHDKIIKYDNYIILRCYPGYFKERAKYSIKEHYAKMWNNHKIYL